MSILQLCFYFITVYLTVSALDYFQGLTGLQHLRELNLSDNEINKVGNSLTSLPVLENVELSGNRLTSLKVKGILGHNENDL